MSTALGSNALCQSCFRLCVLGYVDHLFKPTLEISKTLASIDVDGQLNDPGWRSAARVDNFVERNPGDNTEPEVKTEVYTTYDDHNFYVAFVCHDDPKAIRATMCQRDQTGNDDMVGVLIDPYANASWAYELFVNSYGIQEDALWMPIVGDNNGYDLIWESAAVVTDSGYQAEIALPFASMRFPNQDTQNWRVNFWRNRPREAYKQYSWRQRSQRAVLPLSVCTITGITSVRPGKGIGLMPTMVAHQSGEITNLRNPDSPFRNATPKVSFRLVPSMRSIPM